ncbi:MAG TPA: GlnB [Acidobacteria bacterium]|nr:GlnB [Acidobacteriota bacterium]
MKEIKAIIQPFMVDNVLLALDAITELPGLTVSQVLGWGRQRGATVQDPVREAGHTFAKKTKLEIVVTDELAPRVVQAIVETARTGRAGDGKIFVSEVKEVVRIRTGERAEP